MNLLALFTHTLTYSKPTRPQSHNHQYVNTEPISCFKPVQIQRRVNYLPALLHSVFCYRCHVVYGRARRGPQMNDAVLPAFKQTRPVTPAPTELVRTQKHTAAERLPALTDKRRKTHLPYAPLQRKWSFRNSFEFIINLL